MRVFVVSLVSLALAGGSTSAAPTAPVATGPAIPAGLHLTSAPDGALEIRSGADSIGRLAPKTSPLRRGTPALREVLAAGHRLAELRIPIRGTPGEEIWIGEIEAERGHARRVIWAGLIGPQDVDGESSQWVEVTPERVVEYQTAPEVTRCDGQPPRLFPRAYDFDAGRFRPILPPLPPPAAVKLVARRGDPGMPSGRPIGDFHWIAASTTRGAGSDARGLTAPVELDDGDPATSWAEGVGSDGRGEFLTARAAAGGYGVTGLRILPGDGASPQAFRINNRLRRFQIAFGPAPEQRFDVEVPAEPADDAKATPARWRERYWVRFPQPVASSCLTVILTEVVHGTAAAPPKSYGTTAIGELAIFTDADGPGAVERLVSDLVAAPDCAARLPLVAGLGEPAVLPLARAIALGKRQARECLVEALTAIEPTPKTPESLDALASAVVGASEKEERVAGAALARAGTPAVGPLAALLSSAASPDDRARAARILGRIDDDHAVAALLAAVGVGTPALRGEVVGAAGGSPRLHADALLAALAASEQKADCASGRAADLLRLLPEALERSPESRPTGLAALRGALAADRAFELRGRAIVALGALGPNGDPDALADLRATSDDPVLRFLAARELGGFKTGGTPSAGGPLWPALRAALGDGDPRVRESAAVGLGNQADVGATGALIAGAKQEPWPFVRRAEIEALGRLCGAGAGDLLIRATERDVDEVRRAALVGLTRCKDPRAHGVLLQTLDRRTDNASLRELSAGLLAEVGGPLVAGELAGSLRHAVVESGADLAMDGVAIAILRALAHLGGMEAVAAAVELAGDSRHPFQTAAVEALGVLCDPGAGRATLTKLAAGPETPLSRQAARVAMRCAPK